MKPDSNRLVAIDTATVLLASAAICVASRQLTFMTVFVPCLLVGRFAVVAALARSEGVSLRAEVAFFAICTALGAFNDWNSVCTHGIYQYTVPHFFAFSSIPLWMLLFWGMILRFMARLARWQAIGPGQVPSDRVAFGRRSFHSGTLKVALELALVLITRQAVYHWYGDPFWSWVPFLAALFVMLLVTRPSAAEWKLLGLVLVAGPVVEVLYIRVGHLHHYQLGWIGGVPLWILLWWGVSLLVWMDLALRIERALRNRFR